MRGVLRVERHHLDAPCALGAQPAPLARATTPRECSCAQGRLRSTRFTRVRVELSGFSCLLSLRYTRAGRGAPAVFFTSLCPS